eukprot:gene14103-16677_t
MAPLVSVGTVANALHLLPSPLMLVGVSPSLMTHEGVSPSPLTLEDAFSVVEIVYKLVTDVIGMELRHSLFVLRIVFQGGDVEGLTTQVAAYEQVDVSDTYHPYGMA